MKTGIEKRRQLAVRRIFELQYYFQPYQKGSQFVLQISGEHPEFYPMTYTHKECVEDWCERMGYEFRRLTGSCGTYRGSGYFEYYRYLR